jgi:hypothetical protein
LTDLKIAVDQGNGNCFISVSGGGNIYFIQYSTSLIPTVIKRISSGLSSATILGISTHTTLNTVHFYFKG